MPKTIELDETRAPYNLNLDVQALKQGPVFIEQNGNVIAVILDIAAYQQQATDDFDVWRQTQLQKLEPNRAAFQQLLPELLKTHSEHFVAIYQQRLVDADLNRAALIERIHARGYHFVYIQKVVPTPRVIELDSPTEVWRA